jgi:hypothetical protein
MRARDATVTLRPQGSVTVKFTADRGGDHLGALLGLGGELHVIGDPGVLAGHPDGHLPLLELRGLIQHQHRLRVGQVVKDEPLQRPQSQAGYRLGSDRGSPNDGSTLFSKRVMAQIRSPLRVSTYRPTPWRMPEGARR